MYRSAEVYLLLRIKLARQVVQDLSLDQGGDRVSHCSGELGVLSILQEYQGLDHIEN